MNIILSFIKKYKEIFILLLLIISVIILSKARVREGIVSGGVEEECEEVTQNVLQTMTDYLNNNNRMWQKLTEINNYYINFKESVKEYEDVASMSTQCDDKSVIPINIAEKYMDESEELLKGEDGIYALYKIHYDLYMELKAAKETSLYNDTIIMNTKLDAKGITTVLATWDDIENDITFNKEDPKDDGPESGGKNVGTFGVQVCSVCEATVGLMWSNCIKSICKQMNDPCDTYVVKKTNKWTFNKTKICGGMNICPGGDNAYLSYIQMPNIGITSSIYIDPGRAVPTYDCPDVKTTDDLIACYYGKDGSKHFWERIKHNEGRISSIASAKADILNQEAANAQAILDRETALAEAQAEADAYAAATVDSCGSVTVISEGISGSKTDTGRKEILARVNHLCNDWHDRRGNCRRKQVASKADNDWDLGDSGNFEKITDKLDDDRFEGKCQSA